MNKLPKCKCCKERFKPFNNNSLQKYCMRKSQCITAHRNAVKKDEKRKWMKRKADMRKNLKTKQDHVKELQKIFNKYIRLRDKGKKCISCDRILTGKYDAGHFFPAGSYPNLRFHEHNTNGQCVECNQHKHGNLVEYAPGLKDRIGVAAFELLYELKNFKKHYTIPELMELKTTYKRKIKEHEGRG